MKTLMKPLAAASRQSAAVRGAQRRVRGGDAREVRPGLLAAAPVLPRPARTAFLEKNEIKHPFIRNWMEVLCFLLSGAPASGTLAAEIGYMFDDWYRPNSTLEFPVGGSEAIVEALARGLRKNGGRLELRSHVESVDVDGDVGSANGRATGVTPRNGSKIVAKKP